MRIHFGLDLLKVDWVGCIACVGTFDGVHLGHQTILKGALAEAAKFQLPTVVVTFDRHPTAVLRPESKPAAISTLEQNLAAFSGAGVPVTVVLPFDQAVSRMTAQEFLADVLVKRLRTQKVVVGHDFAMGKDRVGTTAWLTERIPTVVIEPFDVEGVRVSSSAIRKAVAAGAVERARLLLGRPYTLGGVVVGGEKIGRELGFPTANVVTTSEQAVPADGVYAGEMTTTSGKFPAAVSIGVRPTVGGTTKTIEAFLLDYPGDAIYGQSVDLQFYVRLRDEAKFSSLDELKAQIELDVKATRAVHASHGLAQAAR